MKPGLPSKLIIIKMCVPSICNLSIMPFKGTHRMNPPTLYTRTAHHTKLLKLAQAFNHHRRRHY